MQRGDGHKGRPKERVGPGREHGQWPDDRVALRIEDIKAHFRPFTAADPVALHPLDGHRPIEQEGLAVAIFQLGVQILQEPLGVSCYAHRPLPQGFAIHGEIAALAAAFVGHLLVGQHGPQARAPVDDRLLLVRQSVVVQHRLPLDRGERSPVGLRVDRLAIGRRQGPTGRKLGL